MPLNRQEQNQLGTAPARDTARGQFLCLARLVLASQHAEDMGKMHSGK